MNQQIQRAENRPLFMLQNGSRKENHMKINEKGLSIIKQFEGCHLTAYKDPVGIPTIGYGHTAGVKLGQTITQAQADAYLAQDVETAEKAVSRYDDTYHWNENQFSALVSFTFNCGSGNLDKLLASGRRTVAEISAKISTYNKGTVNGVKVVLSGLVRRRAAEKALFDTPVESCPDAAPGLDKEAVRSLQEALNADRITDKEGNALVIDGIKGRRTGEAISKVLLKSGAFDTGKGRYCTGSTGQVVKWVQMRLNTVIGNDIIGLFGKPLETDGKLGADTRLAIGLFQEMRDLTQDYIAGVKTITELLIS